MKKLKLLLLCLPFYFLANSQVRHINQINIVNFTVKNTLPQTIDSWISTTAALVLVAQKVPDARVQEPRLVSQNKKPAIESNNTLIHSSHTPVHYCKNPGFLFTFLYQ
jgi:hypothetical protein